MSRIPRVLPAVPARVRGPPARHVGQPAQRRQPAMTASPCGSENEMMTGINDPTTHTSCWRMPKRAKARPSRRAGSRRCVIESNDGWAIAPHNPTVKAEHHLGEQRAPHCDAHPP